MTIRIGSNIASLGAQRSLGQATSLLERSYERLSSGMRINRASDDAAGLAVATSLNFNARLFTTASRNISDGISMLNIADSAISSQTGILGRMLELAEQSANGTYSATQRGSLQSEYLAMQKEFARIADVTIFNGLKLLRGDRSDGNSLISLQAGITGSSNSILSVRTGDTSFLSGMFNLRALTSSGNSSVGRGEVGPASFSFLTANNPLNSNAVFYTNIVGSDGKSYEVAIAAFEYSDDGTDGSIYSNTGEVAVSFAVFYKDASGNWARPTGMDGVYGAGYNDFTVTFDETTGAALRTSGGSGTTFSDVITMGSATGTLNLDFSALKFFANNDQSQQTAIDFTGVENISRALESLSIVRNRMDGLNSLRGNFGATMSRLSVANNLVQSLRDNTMAAESRISDVDVAEESALLVKNQILQRIGAQILQQTNIQPRIALSLLE